MLNKLDLIDIYRTFHQAEKQHSFQEHTMGSARSIIVWAIRQPQQFLNNWNHKNYVLRQWLAFSSLTPIDGIKSIFLLQSRIHMHSKQKFHEILLLRKILKCTVTFCFTSGSLRYNLQTVKSPLLCVEFHVFW